MLSILQKGWEFNGNERVCLKASSSSFELCLIEKVKDKKNENITFNISLTHNKYTSVES